MILLRTRALGAMHVIPDYIGQYASSTRFFMIMALEWVPSLVDLEDNSTVLIRAKKVKPCNIFLKCCPLRVVPLKSVILIAI